MQELVSYNPVTNEWTTLTSMLVPRSQMGCVVLSEFLYVLGGTNRHNEVLQVNYDLITTTSHINTTLTLVVWRKIFVSDQQVGGDTTND